MSEKHWSDPGQNAEKFNQAKDRTETQAQEAAKGDESRRTPEHGLQDGPPPPDWAKSPEQQREAMEAARESSFAKMREELYGRDRGNSQQQQQERDIGDRGRK